MTHGNGSGTPECPGDPTPPAGTEVTEAGRPGAARTFAEPLPEPPPPTAPGSELAGAAWAGSPTVDSPTVAAQPAAPHEPARTLSWTPWPTPDQAPTTPSGKPSPSDAQATQAPTQALPPQAVFDPPAAPAPPAPPEPPGARGRMLLIGIVAGLLGGMLGGVVGHSLADGGNAASTGVLGSAIPQPDPATPLGPVESVAARVLPSVVQLRVRAGDSGSEGSGMVLSPDGLVLTNNHVVDQAVSGATLSAVFHDGRIAPADIVGRDPTSDIAVIRVRDVSGLTPIELGNSDAVRVGQQVVAIGSPLGLGGSVTSGIVSAVDRAVNVGPQTGATDSTVLNALQTDAAINPGNSGGPLVDMQGRVIGVNSAIATTGSAEGGSIGVGFAIPINQAHRVAKELQSTGIATRAVLGVNVAAQGDDDISGAVIGQVVPGGPAERAGLRAGETITRVDDRLITGGDELVAAIRDHAPGDQVRLVVDGREVVVTLGSKTG